MRVKIDAWRGDRAKRPRWSQATSKLYQNTALYACAWQSRQSTAARTLAVPLLPDAATWFTAPRSLRRCRRMLIGSSSHPPKSQCFPRRPQAFSVCVVPPCVLSPSPLCAQRPCAHWAHQPRTALASARRLLAKRCEMLQMRRCWPHRLRVLPRANGAAAVVVVVQRRSDRPPLRRPFAQRCATARRPIAAPSIATFRRAD